MRIALRLSCFSLAATTLVAGAAISFAAESNTLGVRFDAPEPQAPQRAAPIASPPEPIVAPSASSATPAPLAIDDWNDDVISGEYGFDDNCASCCWLDSLPWCNGNGTFYFGADYLLVKPRFSQSIARVDRTLVSDQTATPETSTLTDTSVAYNYDYQGSYRAFVGYHSCRCGGDIQFTYWRLEGDGSSGPGPAANIAAGTFSAGQLDNNTTADGDRLSASSSVRVNLFDLDFTKCLPLGGSSEPCDACACPRWDVRWLAGVRIADLEHQDNNVVTNLAGAGVNFGQINADFRGAGPRVGLAGRRYFGECARFSLFAKGSASLLLGKLNTHRVLSTPATTPNGVSVFTVQDDSLNRMIPMAEIEVGAGYQVTNHLFFTAGWLFQAWFDAASSQPVEGTNFGPLDTANILGFDGLFVRGEYMF